jgi:CheY-like chemotaxis protein
MLGLEGYEVVEAHNGYEGLQKYLAVSTGPGDYRYPDACVDDLQMMRLVQVPIKGGWKSCGFGHWVFALSHHFRYGFR